MGELGVGKGAGSADNAAWGGARGLGLGKVAGTRQGVARVDKLPPFEVPAAGNAY
jgi:hypothetical protein